MSHFEQYYANMGVKHFNQYFSSRYGSEGDLDVTAKSAAAFEKVPYPFVW
jgi:hypothetical protein